MDLSGWLLRKMSVRPMIVSCPGGTESRLAVERAARRQGWRLSSNPVEANVLVVAGPVTDQFRSYVNVVWQAMPVPRSMVLIDDAATVETRLTNAVAELRDPQQQMSEAAAMVEHPHAEHVMTSHAQDSGGHGIQMGHDMHGGHMHDMGGMEMPGGIPMADRAPDRDGLKLDVLHVPIGPVLADWPPGLIIHAVLQGDVVQEASVEVIGSGRQYPWSVGARRLDSCGRLLAIAGWESAAARARRLRDLVLTGEGDAGREVRTWRRRVGRSRTLRWSLAGVGVLSGREWDDTVYAGDAWDRLVRWLDQADEVTGQASDQAEVVQHLPALLTGGDLAAARLVVASLDPDTDSHG